MDKTFSYKSIEGPKVAIDVKHFTVNRCPLCGSDDIRVVITFRGYDVSPSIDCRCVDCNAYIGDVDNLVKADNKSTKDLRKENDDLKKLVKVLLKEVKD